MQSTNPFHTVRFCTNNPTTWCPQTASAAGVLAEICTSGLLQPGTAPCSQSRRCLFEQPREALPQGRLLGKREERSQANFSLFPSPPVAFQRPEALRLDNELSHHLQWEREL